MASVSSSGVGELYQLLRDGRPRTRAELAEETGLARTTVVVRTAALAAAKLIAPAGRAASSGGRPANRFAFDPLARVIVGIDLGATHGTVGITDLRGDVIVREHRELDVADGPQAVLGMALDMAERLLESTGCPPTRVLGIGIGVPGPVEHDTGRPIRPPIMPGWDAFDIPAWVRSRIDAPVLVDNDVNLLALGERATAWPHVDDLLFIKVSTGIGAGIISGGVLQRGARGSAGDIGHVQVPHGRGEDDLEATASTPALSRQLAGPDAPLLDAGSVVSRILEGDPDAVAAAREAGRAIGEVASICVSILNPSTMVIGGRLGASAQEIIAGVREVVYRRSIPLATQHLNIVPAQGGIDAGVRGAALMVIDDRLSPAAVEELVEAEAVGLADTTE